MASASLTLPDGTHIEISGTPEEVQKLLTMYNRAQRKPPARSRDDSGKSPTPAAQENAPDIMAIVHTIKTCSEAEVIEQRVLDSSSQVDRVLLPLFITSKYFENGVGLTTGDISKVTAELGVRISTPNVSKVITRVSNYVLGDQRRKKGTPVRYKLNRRGVQYVQGVLDHADST